MCRAKFLGLSLPWKQPDAVVPIAMASQLHSIAQEASKLTCIHIELTRKRALVDRDMTLEQFIDDRRSYRFGQSELQ